MQFKIKQIILWPRKLDLPPRSIELELEKINVISGASKTGKSAIIPIIDYCLASDRCSIPVETIRDACSWFGILVVSEEGEKLFARREPQGQKSTGDMFILEGTHVEVPTSAPTKNTTAEAVKTRLDELSGLTKLNFDFDGSGSGFKARPSFRDLVAFTFQPQNIVANPDVLFFKADTFEHREKLKVIFPYVLKAISAEVLAAQHELELVKRQLARKQRELQNIRKVSEQWTAELHAWATQVREYGLIDHAIPEEVDHAFLLGLLQEVVGRNQFTGPSLEGINEAIKELVELQEEEARIDTQLRGFRRRLTEMLKLKENASRFKNSLSVQRERLALAKWLSKLHDSTQACPVCASPVEQEDKIEELLNSLEMLDASVARAGAVPLSFDREIVRVQEEVETCVEKLKGISIRKGEVETRSAEAQQARFRQTEISRFLGRLEKGLEMHSVVGQDGILAMEVEELREREKRLSAMVSREGVARRKRRALDLISLLIGRLLPNLDAERPNDPVELSITDLTLKVKGESREDYLWEIGSGANWLAYHVAVSLALQQFFVQSEPSPVPSFLVYDQPSQVYFPRRLARTRNTATADDPVLDDEDMIAVRKVFETIADAVRQTSGAFQALILDHAGAEVWSDIANVHLVDEWRNGRKLVPMEWL